MKTEHPVDVDAESQVDVDAESQCSHPDAEIVVIATEFTMVSWCSVCGSIRDNNGDHGAPAGKWRCSKAAFLSGMSFTIVGTKEWAKIKHDIDEASAQWNDATLKLTVKGA